jgi:pimeloyl-ACP methyl ester carboxylesterase
MQTVRTPVLEIAYLEAGPANGPPVILLHGWPSDVHDYDGVVPPLVAAGCRVLVPWLRGYGPTRFLDPATPRSGQQAALGADVRDFMDALSIPKAILVGYDWGGRAACVVAALWPERVAGLVSITGYGIQDIAAAARPAAAEQEFRYWYQWYFHTDRGRAGLTANRGELTRLLWRLWSPNWAFDDATLQATTASFDNPDFVDVTIQSYRHRYGNAPGDPAYDELEARLATQPAIAVPVIVLHGEDDGVGPPANSIPRDRLFSNLIERRLIPRAGHFLSRENPSDVVAAVVRLAGLSA